MKVIWKLWKKKKDIFLSLFLENSPLDGLAGGARREDADKSWWCHIRAAEAMGVQPTRKLVSWHFCSLGFFICGCRIRVHERRLHFPSSISNESSAQQHRARRLHLLPGSRPQLYTRAPSSVQSQPQPSESSAGLLQSCVSPILRESQLRQGESWLAPVPSVTLQKAIECGICLQRLLKDREKTGSRVWGTLQKGKGMSFPPTKIPSHYPTSRAFPGCSGQPALGTRGTKWYPESTRERDAHRSKGRDQSKSCTCYRSCYALSGITLRQGDWALV